MIRTLLFVLFVGVIVIGIVMLIVANKDAMMTPKKKGVITVNDKGTKKKNLVGAIISVSGLVLTILVPPSFHQVEAFDTTPIADVEEKMESTTSLALNYIQKKMFAKNMKLWASLVTNLN